MPPQLSQLHLTMAQLPQLQQQPPAPTTPLLLLKALITPQLRLKAPTTHQHQLQPRLKAHITHLPQHKVLMEQQPQPKQHQHLTLTIHLLLPKVPTIPQPKALTGLQPLLPQLHQALTTHLLLPKAPTILLPLPRTPIQQQLLSRNWPLMGDLPSPLTLARFNFVKTLNSFQAFCDI